MKTGIMGGTFDPLHHGHLFLAAEAQHVFKLDRVFFIPSKRGPHKKSAVTAKERYDMVAETLKDKPEFPVLDIELKREGMSYSIDTIEELKTLYPEDDFYFITGADVMLSIETWNQYEDVLKYVTFIAASRAGKRDDALIREIERLERVYGSTIEWLDLLDLEISSSDIRRRIAAGKPITYLVPDTVEHMIRTHNYYK